MTHECINVLAQHYYKGLLKTPQGGQKKPLLLMPSINRGGHFLLTEAVKETASQNRLTEAVTIKITASVNTPIFRGGHIMKNRLG